MVISKMQGNLPNSPMSDAVLSPAGVPASPGDELESLSLAEQRLFHLQRQLDIETKVEILSQGFLNTRVAGASGSREYVEPVQREQGQEAAG